MINNIAQREIKTSQSRPEIFLRRVLELASNHVYGVNYFYHNMRLHEFIEDATYNRSDFDVIAPFFPKKQIAIMYDGVFTHAEKIEKDEAINSYAQEYGFEVIRFREKGLPLVAGSINYTVEHNKGYIYLDAFVKKIEIILKELFDIDSINVIVEDVQKMFLYCVPVTIKSPDVNTIEKMAEDFLIQGMTVKDIAKKHNYHHATVTKYLIEFLGEDEYKNIITSRYSFSEEDVLCMVEDYKNGMSCHSLEKKYKSSWERISKIIISTIGHEAFEECKTSNRENGCQKTLKKRWEKDFTKVLSSGFVVDVRAEEMLKDFTSNMVKGEILKKYQVSSKVFENSMLQFMTAEELKSTIKNNFILLAKTKINCSDEQFEQIISMFEDDWIISEISKRVELSSNIVKRVLRIYYGESDFEIKYDYIKKRWSCTMAIHPNIVDEALECFKNLEPLYPIAERLGLNRTTLRKALKERLGSEEAYQAIALKIEENERAIRYKNAILFLSELKNGLSVSQIAKLYKVSPGTVRNHTKEFFELEYNNVVLKHNS